MRRAFDHRRYFRRAVLVLVMGLAVVSSRPAGAAALFGDEKPYFVPSSRMYFILNGFRYFSWWKMKETDDSLPRTIAIEVQAGLNLTQFQVYVTLAQGFILSNVRGLGGGVRVPVWEMFPDWGSKIKSVRLFALAETVWFTNIRPVEVETLKKSDLTYRFGAGVQVNLAKQMFVDAQCVFFPLQIMEGISSNWNVGPFVGFGVRL